MKLLTIGCALVVGFLILPPVSISPIRALTCADLPAINLEIDHSALRYGWIVLIGLVLALIKLGEIIIATTNWLERLLLRAWRAFRSRRERTAL